jgi:hypothetical protein
MTTSTHEGNRPRGFPWRISGWAAAVVLLLLPLVAGAPWTASDYLFAAVMLGTLGLGFELIVRKSRNMSYRAGAVLLALGAFLTVWVNGAVGMIGSEDNTFNLLFLGVPVVALIGAIAAGFRAPGMALAMTLAALGQGVLSAIGMSSDLRGGMFSMAFVGLWLLAAALFHNAARDTA